LARADGPSGGRCGQRDPAIVGYELGELPGGSFDAGTVVSLKKIGAHQAAGVASAGVVDDRLEAVADFDAIFAVGRSNEEKNAAIVFFVADTELFEEVVAILIDVFAIEGTDGDDGHLGAGFLFDFEAEGFEAGFRVGRNDAGQVGDVAGGVNVLDVVRVGGAGECQNQEKKKEPRREGSRGGGNAFGGGKPHAL